MADLKSLLGDQFKENMSIEEITAALADKTFVDPATLPKSVSKETFDKTAHELSEAKKQLAAKQTDDEKAAEAQQAIQDKLANLEKENSQMKLKESFISNGYDAKTAADLATAYSEGNMTKFATLNAKYMETTKTALQASIKEDLLKNTPGLQGGGKGDGDGTEPSIGEKAAQAYNQQFAPAPAAAQTN
ncbi:MAG TPA: hypothetical protein VHO94_04095 [Oscillospiraceae bacterium]|nr:hypothetical protein [Oscillospiraceae bacterium]